MRVQCALGALMLGLAAACGPIGPSTTPLPTIVLEGGSSATVGDPGVGQVTASGHVVAAQEVHLAFPVAGIVESVSVSVGDPVRIGQLLLELEGTTAQLQVDQAQRALREMTSSAAIAAADQAVASAQQAQDTAQKKVNALTYPRATEAFIDNLRGQITLARKELADATRAFNHVKDLASNDPGRARAQVRMTAAQINLNKLVGNYNWYTGQPSEIDVALTYANLDAANASVQEAQWYAAALRGEPLPEEASGARLAELEAARDAVEAAQADLEATHLVSPIAGQVAALEIFPGEYATPGQMVVVVSDVRHLRVETTDLSERDVASIQIGRPATVFVEAIGQEVAGTVLAVSPVADILGGDVVYMTTIELASTPADLRPGMSAEVHFETSP
jgi:multidrug efflux pump subunit AcrA (membrane-fusion protein)